ncbi:hypothetical protein FDECE_6612 [Fusarium decemcellulare]|nr:hypothetical protein FDECE_6612 [Fusarium decemcellulare]
MNPTEDAFTNVVDPELQRYTLPLDPSLSSFEQQQNASYPEEQGLRQQPEQRYYDELPHHQGRVRQRVSGPMAPPPKPKLNVGDFPASPRVERIFKHIRVVYNGMEVAETSDAFWVLQKHRPPEYYLPKSAVQVPFVPTGWEPRCASKGRSTHYAVKGPDGIVLANRVWSYDEPKPGFEAIKGYVSFYARPWQCFVDGERVVPQRSDLRGGWVTADVVGVDSADDPEF